MPISFYFLKYYSLNVRAKLNSPVTSRDERSSSPKRGRWQQLRYYVLNYISPLLFNFEIYRVITLELGCLHKGCNLIALGVEWGGGLGKGVEVSIFEMNLFTLHFQRGYSPKIYTWRFRPEVHPLTHLSGCNLIALGVDWGENWGKGVEVSIFEMNLFILHFQRGYSPKIYTGRFRPRSTPPPLTHLYIIFDGKGTTFVYLLLTNGNPFHVSIV